MLLEPTRIYVRALLGLLGEPQSAVHALAHITGGGLLENVPRVLAPGQRARIDRTSWETPPLFQWLQDAGRIEDREMLRTFNCGIGFLVAATPDRAAEVLNPKQQALVVAMVTKDQTKAAQVRGQMTMDEITGAAEFMMSAPQVCGTQ